MSQKLIKAAQEAAQALHAIARDIQGPDGEISAATFLSRRLRAIAQQLDEAVPAEPEPSTAAERDALHQRITRDAEILAQRYREAGESFRPGVRVEIEQLIRRCPFVDINAALFAALDAT